MSGTVEVIRCRESCDCLHLSRGVCHGSGTRGWTGELLKFWDKYTLYEERVKRRQSGGGYGGCYGRNGKAVLQ